jgi:general secretion pathway protein C
MKKILTRLCAVILIVTSGVSCYFTGMIYADTLREPSISHLELKGTLFTQSINPLAIVENTKNNQILMYEIGDNIEGLELLAINRGEIVLAFSKRKYTLSFPQGPVSEVFDLPESGNWFNITRQGDTIITDSATVKRALLRAPQILKGIKAGPYSENGSVSGVAITKLEETGILNEIGIEQGDIIKSVNGLTLNSPYQIFNAYRRLRNKDKLKIDIIRKGRPITLTYIVNN